MIAVFIFILGGGIGAMIDHYYYITIPQLNAMAEAQRQQEALNKAVRHGKVVEVKQQELTVAVTESGEETEKGKTITVTLTPRTNIQKGDLFLNRDGQVVDITQHLKPGIEVDLLVRGDKAMALYWEPGEEK
ncbi:hypothetical protein [Desulforamulus reducens]|uniref:hypothetical protein n=1 Tax=Desulforamulus reducens TaxID=59610 RepID=UPI0012EAE18E|nr:hypothetical protein [Desulforamulus reducens]